MAGLVTGGRVTRLMKTVRLTAVVLLAVLAGACASGGPKRPPAGSLEPDKFLYEHGADNLTRKRWIVSREYFRQLIDTYPQSKYRADAKLGMGDAYLGEHSSESFVLAINEFREFLSFYPTHERAHYAQFKLAMAHFYQMRSPMRDQTETREAIRELQTFVSRYPTSPLIDEGRRHLREAKDRLADWDFGVAYHYFRIKWYPGVVGRLVPLLQSDPEYTNRDAAYYYLGESLLKVNRQAEALPYFERLVKEFETSEYLEKTKKRIAEIKATLPAAPGKQASPHPTGTAPADLR
jgi:outer membrane protein assembly factor BamD